MHHSFTRRESLRWLGVAAAGLAAGVLPARLAFAAPSGAAATDNRLVVVLLRGALDGLLDARLGPEVHPFRAALIEPTDLIVKSVHNCLPQASKPMNMYVLSAYISRRGCTMPLLPRGKVVIGRSCLPAQQGSGPQKARFELAEAQMHPRLAIGGPSRRPGKGRA